MAQLNNKWALITGSSRGIGRQIAIGLAQHRCNIMLHATNPAHCSETLADLKRFKVETIVVSGILGDVESEMQIIDGVIREVGYVDILYNNAAVMSQWFDSISDIPLQEWERIFQINFFSQLRLCNALLPMMRKRNWGRIINLVTGMENTPQLSPYSTSKEALQKFTRELAFELKDTRIRANTLDPGWIKTDLGGENADHDLESVLPGALIPALVEDDGPNGEIFRAQQYRQH